MTMPLHYHEAVIHDDAAAAWHLTMPSDTNISHINIQAIPTVEDDNGNDREKEERYVVWDGSGAL
jgi:hypothetical protein